MGKIRVLIVDDAVAIRRVLADVIAADPDLEVAAVAPNGRIGLAKIAQSEPDVVILDVEMPELNGLETLTELRRSWPRLPVIMYSTLTRRGALATLDALAAGANHYVTKPSGVVNREEALARVREELLPVIKALHNPRPVASAPPPPRLPRFPVAPRRSRIEVVAIGVSTGGPNALADVIPRLPATLSAPVLIVQHMPPIFTTMLAERLNQRSALQVHEAVDGESVQNGHVYIAPGNYHMSVTRGTMPTRIQLHQGPPENSCRPSADVLFRGVAESYGSGVLGVVLTGMGQDALRGSEEIRNRGGVIFAQDEATSVVWGMPGSVVRAGLADRVIPINMIASEIADRVRVEGRSSASSPAGAAVL